MGLLDKTNPQATRESVIRWAVGGGSLFVIILLIKLAWSSSPDPNWPWLVLAGGIAGAFLGGLMEWQLFDSDLYEVMLEVDEEFAVTLAKDQECDTVDELYEMVFAELHENSETLVDENEVWNRLKTLLVKQLALKPEQVVPSARFFIDIKI